MVLVCVVKSFDNIRSKKCSEYNISLSSFFKYISKLLKENPTYLYIYLDTLSYRRFL